MALTLAVIAQTASWLLHEINHNRISSSSTGMVNRDNCVVLSSVGPIVFSSTFTTWVGQKFTLISTHWFNPHPHVAEASFPLCPSTLGISCCHIRIIHHKICFVCVMFLYGIALNFGTFSLLYLTWLVLYRE